MWDRYLDLNPFYYLSTCALAEYLTRTKVLKCFILRDFFLVEKYIDNKFYDTVALD